MKKALIALAVVALLGVSAQAGEIKSHEWPCTYVPLEVTSIPVVMDVGFWFKVKDQDSLKITLAQDESDIHKFSGCCDMAVETNFNAVLSCSIDALAAVPGNYSCGVNPSTVNAPGGTVQVCATLTDANLGATPGGSKGVQVATVKIKVRPA